MLVLGDEDRRRILYSALLRYGGETQPLRERALQKLVLSALFGTSEAEPLTVGQIQTTISSDGSNAKIRVETIQTILSALILDEKVVKTTKRQKHAYYVPAAVNEQLGAQLNDLAGLFSECLGRLSSGTEPVIESNVVAEIGANFISHCFGLYGRQIANALVEDLASDDLLQRIDVRAALGSATRDRALTGEALALVEARCVEFLRSRHPADERLKFYVTQAYYFAQLLGLEEQLLRPLTDELFSGSVFYLDTNIVVRRLLASVDRPSALSEVKDVARRLSIELKLTRATINEARRVAAARGVEMKAVLEKLPEEITSDTSDDFLAAFFEAREKTPDLTVDKFLAPFDRIREVFQDENNIEVDEVTEAEVIDENTYATDRVTTTIRDAASTRRRPKTGNALLHDVAHYHLIVTRRSKNIKTFFLTQDGTLLDAGLSLKHDHAQSFAFSLAAFLQGISPYISAAEEAPFLDAFSVLLLDSLPPVENVFEMSDLRLLTEIWDDVEATPPDKLTQAYHFVRRGIVSMAAQRRPQSSEVLHGVRRFLSSSSAEQQRALKEQIAQERLLRERAEDVTRTSKEKTISAEERLAKLTVQMEELAASIERDREQKATEDAVRLRNEQRAARITLTFVWLLGALGWLAAPVLAAGLAGTYPTIPSRMIVMIVAVLSASTVAIGSALFVKQSGWTVPVQLVALTCVFAVVLIVMGLLEVPFIGVVATALGIAAVFAPLFAR